MTSSNGDIFRVSGPLWGKSTSHCGYPSQRQVARILDVFFEMRLNKWLSKQSGCRWFKTPWRSLCRHCNDGRILYNSPSKGYRVPCPFIHINVYSIIGLIFQYSRRQLPHMFSAFRVAEKYCMVCGSFLFGDKINNFLLLIRNCILITNPG